ncbi:MAG: UDP-N-acetylmuramoyl-L-alanyl-D-glutamate--2,6-diaminopimelate ligase [Bacteroidales bacterium]|nr:UDP-N-acetylmuramoyl-L-alanyl-D-glutamate--2,6-diaminopimelate ligase [Bacteroidales bacterium]
MRKLSDILLGVECEITGDKNISISSLTFDSRQAKPNSVFVAVSGTQTDGHNYIDKAVGLGAKVIVCERISDEIDDVTFVKVDNSAVALGKLASNFYGNPSEKLNLVGVTGTNGKTSIATLLHQLFTDLGYKCGLLSTVCVLVGNKKIEATHTTPDAIQINEMLDQMAKTGCSYVFMEVSSHSVHQERITGLTFKGGIFTNITHDHLDYHKTFDAYIKAKKKFFDELPYESFALVNTDDKNGKIMVQNTEANIKTFGLKSMADYKALVVESHFEGMMMRIDGKEIWVKLTGEFNASNLLAVYATAIELGAAQDEVLPCLSNLKIVDGRFEIIRSNTGTKAVIDYAHTPDALKNVLETISQIRVVGEQIITVVGAGGNRDKDKRPKMGKIASNYSDKVVLTSDNPRDEEPSAILEDIEQGISQENKTKVLQIVDRREAIKTACMLAGENDIILIAGKGHETYQEIKGQRSFFSDKQIVEEQFKISN